MPANQLSLTLHAGQGERYWLRLLLTEVKGAKNWQNMATVEGRVYNCLKEAAFPGGCWLTYDEQDKMLQSASFVCSPAQLRNLFACVLVWHEPNEAGQLWQKWADELSQDYLYKARQVGFLLFSIFCSEMQRRCVAVVETIFNTCHNYFVTIVNTVDISHHVCDMPCNVQSNSHKNHYDKQ